MTGDTVECYNCGRANPAWAQVCRSCGVPIRAGSAASAPSGPIPTDRESLISMGAVLAAIAGAILVGLLLSGLIPEAAPIAEPTDTPEPTPSPASSQQLPSEAAGTATPQPTPALIGTVTFGTGLNGAQRATGKTREFGPGTNFCHSVELTEPFGVDEIQEEVLRVEDDGTLTEVQARQGSNLGVDPASQIAGFCSGAADSLIQGWGVGRYILRDYRNADTPELIAQGRFRLTN
jgi:hypothetical protein